MRWQKVYTLRNGKKIIFFLLQADSIGPSALGQALAAAACSQKNLEVKSVLKLGKFCMLNGTLSILTFFKSEKLIHHFCDFGDRFCKNKI